MENGTRQRSRARRAFPNFPVSNFDFAFSFRSPVFQRLKENGCLSIFPVSIFQFPAIMARWRVLHLLV
jgi:hypothetical protein